MPKLPTGTVTLVFTDVEGSTRLLQELGREHYVEALEAHRRLLRRAFGEHGGVEVEMQGDSFHFAFASARDAVVAAAAAQQALASHHWENEPIRVRMGLHTGEPVQSGGLYAGLDVHRAARVMAAGHGGQVLLSQTTRRELDDSLLVRDLGEHRLKDITTPEWLFQLGNRDFPPLKSLNNTNLPTPANPLIGRERQLNQLGELLGRDAVRLLTLTGPGGTGKTRLALELAGEVVGDYANGVFFVPLAPIRDVALVLPMVAQTLGIKEQAGEPLAQTLGRELEARRMLLFLDNLEQVIDAARELAGLLQRAPKLTLLVTSRELLRVQGEHEFPVPPLAEDEAVALFCARSQLEPNGAIAALCQRLDNLPLAVELAAARTGVLSPVQILERLAQRLDLKGGRDADPRQQTLRATIDWSYDLLSREEQRLFARLSVFAGGWTLEAAQEVCDADFDTLESLIDKSLVRQPRDLGERPRFWMLETIREYASGQLEESAELAEVVRRHGDYYQALAERAEPELTGSEQLVWLRALRLENDNLRLCLSRAHERGEIESVARVAAALREFWDCSGQIREGEGWVRAVLDQPLSAKLRARVLVAAGLFADRLDAFDTAAARFDEAIAIGEQADPLTFVLALTGRSFGAMRTSESQQAVALGERALERARSAGDTWATAFALNVLGCAVGPAGDGARAMELFEESISLFRECGDRRNMAPPLANLGPWAVFMGAHARADAALAEACALAEEFDDVLLLANARHNLGLSRLYQGDIVAGRSLLAEAVDTWAHFNSPRSIAEALDGLAAVACEDAAAERAATLWGAADAIREALHTKMESSERWLRERYEPPARGALGEAHFGAARKRGLRMPLDEAVEYALSTSADEPAVSRRSPSPQPAA